MTTHTTKEGLLQRAAYALKEFQSTRHQLPHIGELETLIEDIDDALARAAELEQSQPAQISHHEDCWRDPKHHACAVAKIEQSQSAECSCHAIGCAKCDPNASPWQQDSTSPERSAGNAGEVAGWQPIATAPKDGANILLVNVARNIATGMWQQGKTEEYSGWVLRGGNRPNVFFNGHHGPTHWQPLPEPPQ